MNEEEKKAIYFLKETNFDYLEYDMCVSSVEIISNLVERLQKEKEELKRKNEALKILEDDIQDKRIAYVDELEFEENYIPKQIVKDKIEEYKNMLKTCNKAKDIDRIKAINERISELEELLEGRK